MYRNICVIGIGTLGGFLSKSISDLDEIEEICIVDYDIVEERNLRNSIYQLEHLGKEKVDAIEEILKRPNLKINKINEKYIEGITKLPKKYDLVLDCRDFTYDRNNEIDCRLYITSRNLIIDSRKNIKYNTHLEGKYTVNISKNDLKNAAFQVSTLIHSGVISDLIYNQVVHNIELDYTQKSANKTIMKSKDSDLLYESNQIENKLINLKEMFGEVIDQNKNQELIISLGGKGNPYSIEKLVPKQSFKTYNDVLETLQKLTNLPYTHNSYIINKQVINTKIYIELLPETGAA